MGMLGSYALRTWKSWKSHGVTSLDGISSGVLGLELVGECIPLVSCRFIMELCWDKFVDSR